MGDIFFAGTSLKDIRAFPGAARRKIGYELHLLQCGDDPSDWKPMSMIGKGVREIRISAAGQFRVIYVAKLENAIYVLHAFQKKSQKTPQRDTDLAKQRLIALQTR